MSDTVGSRIRKLRKAAKQTQDAAAEAAGITRAFLSDIERGKKTGSVATINALADLYKVPVDYLRGGEPISTLEDASGVAKTPEERTLLRNWRALNEVEMHAVKTLLARLAAAAEPKNIA